MISKNTIRTLWVLNFAIFLAAVLPMLSGHPYPKSIRSYLEYGLLFLYLVSGLCIVAIVSRSRKSGGPPHCTINVM
jgi:hypothetical protein